MYRKFAFLLSICILFLQGFSQDLTFREIDFNNYLGSKTLKEYNIRIYKAAMAEIIAVYKTDSLKQAYKIYDLLYLGGQEEVFEVCPDPEYPDYCYDSAVLNPFYEGDISGNYIAEKWTYLNKKQTIKTEYTALALLFNMTFGGVNLGKQPLFWVDMLDLEKVFSATELYQIKQAIFKETQFVYSDSTSYSMVGERAIDLRNYIGLYTILELNYRIHTAATKGRVSVYTSVKLDSNYSANEAYWRGMEREIIEVYPENDYWYDSTIYNPCRSDQIMLNSTSEFLYFNEKDFSCQIKPNAFALRYWNSADDEGNLFWISYKDLKKTFSKLELAILNQAIYKATVDQHHMYERY